MSNGTREAKFNAKNIWKRNAISLPNDIWRSEIFAEYLLTAATELRGPSVEKIQKYNRAERRFLDAVQRPGFAARYCSALLELERAARFMARAKVRRKPL